MQARAGFHFFAHSSRRDFHVETPRVLRRWSANLATRDSICSSGSGRDSRRRSRVKDHPSRLQPLRNLWRRRGRRRQHRRWTLRTNLRRRSPPFWLSALATFRCPGFDPASLDGRMIRKVVQPQVPELLANLPLAGLRCWLSASR